MHVTPLYWYVNVAAAPREPLVPHLSPLIPNTRQPVPGLPHGKALQDTPPPGRGLPLKPSQSTPPKLKLFLTEEIAA